MFRIRQFMTALRQPYQRPEIAGINNPEEWKSANFDSWYFHVIEKTALHLILRYLPSPPPHLWPDLFTGARKEIAVFLLEEYFKYEKQRRRNLILEKAFYFTLKLYEHDNNYAEVFDFLLWRLLSREDVRMPVQAQHLDPGTWFQDENPKLAGRSGRFIPDRPAPPFRVLARTEDAITVSAEISRPIISIKPQDDLLDETWIALDLNGGTGGDGRWTYPIIAAGPDLIPVAQAYSAATGRCEG